MKNILIIDDDAIFLSFLGSVFDEPNYNVKLARSIDEALLELKNGDYQILITDMFMPNQEDGLNFIDKVYNNNSGIIIIVVSGQSEINFVIKVLSEKKVYDYILKPVKKEILKLSVEKALEVYSLRKKKDDFSKQEESVFKDMIQIFDWKKEINTKYLDSLAPNLIRQINISMLQGSGIGSLTSVLSIFLSKAIYQMEQKSYLVPEKIFNLIKNNYHVVNALLTNLSEAQAIMHETIEYADSMHIYNTIPLFRETIDGLSTMLDLKNQKIVLSELPRLSHTNKIIFNSEKMKIVLHELFINAMKYSGMNDKIYVLFFSNQNSFDVKFLNKAYKNGDESFGISGKNESRVFEPFYRLHNVVDDNYTLEKFKFGLGLTIVKKILQLHNADISVYSVKNNINYSDMDVCVWMRFPYIKRG